MKKIILMMMALCVMAFVGCDKEDKSGGSLVVNGVNLVGTWAEVRNIWFVDQYEDWFKEWQDGGRVSDIIVVTSDGYINYYSSDDYNGYIFSDGYLRDCTMENFEKDGGAKFSVEKGGIYISGLWIDLRFEGNDFVTWYDEGDPYMQYKRVKGFK